MILSNITLPLLGLVDTAVIGHLSDSSYLGGVAIGSMVITLLFWGAGFLRMSTTGVVAQAVGRGDFSQVVIAWRNSVSFSLILAALFLLLSQPLWQLAQWLTEPSEAVAQHAATYFYIRIWGAPAALLNLTTLGCLLGMQQARGPVILLIVTNLANIALDLLLVVGLGLEVAGAAWASLIADYLGAGFGLWLLQRCLMARGCQLWQKGLPTEVKAYSELLRLNMDIFLRSLALQLCFSFMTLQGSRLGDDVLAANAVLLNFLVFVAFALDGFAYAIEALGGKALGAGTKISFERTVIMTLKLAGVTSIGFSLMFACFGEMIIYLLTDIEAIRQTASSYLPWMILLPVVAVWCYIFDGIYIAAMAGRVMRNAMLFCALGVYLPVWWFTSSWQNHGLWLALCCFMAARGATLAVHYWRYHHRWFVKVPVET